MLYINALRGKDSTGVFYVTTRGDIQTHKEVGESAKFLETKEWDSTERELFTNGQAVVGHCRAATKGAKTDANAHPFIVDNKIILVHNGTYFGDHNTLAKTDVDSHAIAHVLAETSDIPAALRKINAAYALVWYNTETNTLYAARNKHRPLFFAQLQDGSMMFASEISFLYTAAWRNDLKIQKDYPIQLPENQLFSCDLHDIKKPYEWVDMDSEYKYIVPPMKKEEPKQVETKSSPLVLLPPSKVSTAVKRHYNSVPTLTEVAEEMGIGKISNNTKYNARELASTNDILFVEATDYHAVDATAGVYYVYGKIISTKEHLNGMIAGWEITADSEYEVLDYTMSRFYNCTVEFACSRGVLRPEGTTTWVWKMSEAVEVTKTPVESLENA